MSVTLGKRKRVLAASSAVKHARRPAPDPASNASSSDESQSEDGDDDDDDDDAEAARAAFARAFESKFAPLQGSVATKTSTRDSTHQEDDLSDFDGFESEDDLDDNQDEDDDESDEDDSEDEFDTQGTAAARPVEVVTYTGKSTSSSTPTVMSKARLKAFMTSKAPLLQTDGPSPTTNGKARTASGADDDAAEPNEALNLRHDLELQRLISESHLLHPEKQPKRNHRQQITDLRLQAIGSRGGILGQERMPLAMRKGIAAKKTQREELRRREARENGIILERAAPEAKSRREEREAQRKRERGVGAPGVGKFKGGTLSLSRQDIGAIRGSMGGDDSTRFRRGGGGGGRGGGRTRGKRGRGR